MKLYRTNDTVNSKEQEVLDIINQYPGLNSSNKEYYNSDDQYSVVTVFKVHSVIFYSATH